MSPTISLSFTGRLISTTDIDLAGLLNKKISLKRILRGKPCHYEATTEGTIIFYIGRELYEMEAIK